MTRPRVLVVDDELDARVMMRFFLESWGYDVGLVGSGAEALDEVASRRPSLVLLDVQMPEMDGIETCGRLKGDADTEHVPVILLAGDDDSTAKVRGLRAGADDYVAKRVDPEELQARIETVLRRSRRFEASAALHEDAALTGSLEEKSFPEALQLAMAYGQSGTLLMTDGARAGRVYLVEGDPVHAELDGFTGEAAFFKLSLWSTGTFSYRTGEATKPHTIQQGGTSLLLEVTRRLDEWSRLKTKLPELDHVPHRSRGDGKREVSLTSGDWTVLRHVDGLRSFREIAEALNLDDYEMGHCVLRLMSAGAMSLEPEVMVRDSFYDVVPSLQAPEDGEEPIRLSGTELRLVACIDGLRDVGALLPLTGLTRQAAGEALSELRKRGLVRLEPQSRRVSTHELEQAESGPRTSSHDVAAFRPRLRAIGLD